MAKLAQSTIKYVIKADFSIDGAVEKHDVIGAIFGQTEGLLGPDLDLRELQRTGKVGRIEVEIKESKDKTSGQITIPSSLSNSETAMIAASLETIEKVGPYEAEINVKEVRDVREEKRKLIADRAKDILRQLIDQEVAAATALSGQIEEEMRTAQVQEWEGLPCGPGILTSDEVVVVEGRADVMNLLKNGITNVIAVDGAKIPKAILNLTKEKITTFFVDGDRAGLLLLAEALKLADVDYIAIAPEEKEVEELSKKEIFKALRDRVSAEQWRTSQAGSRAKSGKQVQ